MNGHDPNSRNCPELMSPAGGWPEMEAAVAAGADAVYFGLQHFTARAKVGFSLDELPQVIQYLHRYAVKGFITFNTLVFDHELRQAQDTIAEIAAAGADAIIVQDIGVARVANVIAPDLAIHGSTQMSITSAEGAELAASLGCQRVVLGRELALSDIRKIAAATDVELEVFVHGALCVSYSGQCFSSEAWGGRSANRGKCAQACRLSYDLIVDGERRELDDARFLLSPGDLYALEQVPELTDIGIACLKIEGRYKGPEYVALTTKAYRDAIDNAVGRQTDSAQVTKDDLEQIYSRGLSPSFISGVDHQAVVKARAPRHRGLRIGTVATVMRSAVVVDTIHTVAPGDGLVFDAADWRSPDQPEEGGHVFEVQTVGDNQQQLSFGHGDINFQRIRPGDSVFRTHSPAINKKAKSIIKQNSPTTGVRFAVTAVAGQPLTVEATAETSEQVRFVGTEPLPAAAAKPLDTETCVQQLSRLGGTPFHLLAVELQTDGGTFCPVSMLNEARRELVGQLLLQRESTAEAKTPASTESFVLPKTHTKRSPSPAGNPPQLHLLVRNAEQLVAAIALQPSSITLDYLELYGLRPAVETVREAGVTARVASPRILKPSEQKVVRFLLSLDCQILVRSGGLLHDLVNNFANDSKYKLPQLHGDFSLNAANRISFDTYLKMGLSRICPTYDLNAQQIEELANCCQPEQIEVVAFQHLPVFHTEHCVFCRFLSSGTDNTNCGHPCEQHQVALLDANGHRHAVLADVGCRNTVFNAQAQVSAEHLKRWLDAGLHHYRLEFVHQSPAEVEQITMAFSQFFDNRNVNQLESDLQKFTAQGISEGSLFVPRDYKQLVQLS